MRKKIFSLMLIMVLIVCNCVVVYADTTKWNGGSSYVDTDPGTDETPNEKEVTGTFSGTLEKVYRVDIVWTNMAATYNSEDTWDPDNLKYNKGGGSTWSCSGAVTAENRSNADVWVTLGCNVDYNIVGDNVDNENDVKGTFKRDTSSAVDNDGKILSAVGSSGTGPKGRWTLEFSGVPTKDFGTGANIATATVTVSSSAPTP